MMMISCTASDSSGPVLYEDMEINMSLQPAFEHGFDVTQIIVTITRGDFIDSINLDIVGHTATGTFFELAEGTYEIVVEVYEEDTLIATGSGSGVVVAGETTTVQITLEFTGQTGNLEIIVDWGDEFPDPPERILFIGNSITYWNGGIAAHLQNFVLSSDSTTVIECEAITGGGFTLQNHYNDSTIEEIQQGNWDYVVLQERTSWPVDEPELFYEYATLFDSVITDVGAQTVFFFSWPYESDFDTMIEEQAAAFNYISDQLDAPVIPVARAWQLSRQEDPELGLFIADGNHPNEHGTYLAVCTFYAYFWNLTPEGFQYVNDGIITNVERDFLQSIAWQTYCIY
jgi:uncharacterized protein DUF4886